MQEGGRPEAELGSVAATLLSPKSYRNPRRSRSVLVWCERFQVLTAEGRDLDPGMCSRGALKAKFTADTAVCCVWPVVCDLPRLWSPRRHGCTTLGTSGRLITEAVGIKIINPRATE